MDVLGGESFLLRNARLLGGQCSDIRVRDGLIVEIGEVVEAADGETVFEAGGGLCTRPLTDSHIHLDKAGNAAALDAPPPSIGAAIEAMSSLKARFAQHVGALADAMEAQARMLAAGGTRRARASVDVDESWGLTAFEAAVGVKERVADVIDLQIVAFPQEGLTPQVEEMLRHAASAGADVVGAHTEVDADPSAHITAAAAIARAYQLPLEVHVDEAADPTSPRLRAVLDGTEGVGDLTLVHCLALGKLPEGDRTHCISELVARQVKVVVAPSILNFGLRLAPVGELLDAGVTTLIGSDNLRDVFVPFGTGRMLEALRTVARVSGISDPKQMQHLFAGVTDVGFDAMAGEGTGWRPGTTASMTVFAAGDVGSIVNGDDEVLIQLYQGRRMEEAA